jgi:hypothetical protein
MASLERWFAREARREAWRATVDDVVVFGRFELYVRERSVRFLIARLVQEMLHVTELYLLFMFASDDVFLTGALVVFGARTATNGWWGGLEVLRAGIRDRARDGRMVTIGPWILRWTEATAVVGAGLAIGALVVAVARLATTGIDLATAYVTVWLVGLAIELPLRAFHAGAYALRRVYLPTVALLAPSVLRALLLVALWPWIGLWSLVPASACATVATAALTAYFTWRTYEAIELWPLADARAGRTPRLLPLRGDLRRFAAASVSGACTVLGHLSGLALLSLAMGDADLWLGVLVYVILAAPLADACLAWARLFYPDFARLDDPILGRFRAVLEQQLLRWSPIVGAALWLPSLLVVSILPGERRVGVALLTLALFVVRARLAAIQLVAFTNARYGFVVAVSGAAVGAGSLDFLLGSYAAVGVAVAIAVLWFLKPPPPRWRLRGVMPLAAMIAAARRIHGAGTWTLGEFDPGSLLHGAGTLLRVSARRFGAIGVDREHLLLRWQPRGARMVAEDDPLEDAQRRRWQSGATDAVAALARWTRAWPAHVLPRPCPPADVLDEFRTRFPDGAWIEPGRPIGAPVRSQLTWRQRRHVLDEAVRFAFGGPPTALLPVDVTALQHDGILATLFLVPRTAPATARRAWRHWLRRVAIANALAELAKAGPPATTVRADAPRTPWRSARRWPRLRPVR